MPNTLQTTTETTALTHVLALTHTSVQAHSLSTPSFAAGSVCLAVKMCFRGSLCDSQEGVFYEGIIWWSRVCVRQEYVLGDRVFGRTSVFGLYVGTDYMLGWEIGLTLRCVWWSGVCVSIESVLVRQSALGRECVWWSGICV